MEAFILLIACGAVYGLLWMWQRCTDEWLSFLRRAAMDERMRREGKEQQ